jgi:uncharacterized membrane protein YeiH
VTIIPLWLDLAAVGVGAFQGALFAIVRHRFDLVGVTVVAGVTGMGGGILRDLLLGVRPALLADRYLLVVLVAIVCAILLGKWHEKGRKPVVLADAVAISLYAIAGTYKSLELNTSILVAILLGVITAVGGGVMRDLIAGERPAIFQGGPLYATAALAGAATFAILYQFDLALDLSVVISAAVIFTVRLLSLRFKWYLPQIIR